MDAHPPPARTARRIPVPLRWIGGAGVALAGMLVAARIRGPFDPVGRGRMANVPGELASDLAMGAVELVLLALVLRAWSYRHSPGRAAAALALWLPWTLLTLTACMHCGSLGAAHGLWRVLVAIGLLAAMAVSRAARGRRTASPVQPST